MHRMHDVCQMATGVILKKFYHSW